MNNLPNPAPTATPQAPAGASATVSVQQGKLLFFAHRALSDTTPALALLPALGQAVQALTDAASALVDSPLSRVADALIAVDNAADAVDAVSAAIAHTLTPRANPSTAVLPPIAPALPHFLRTTWPWITGLLYAVVPAQPLGRVTDFNEKWFAITRGKYVGLTKNLAVSLKAVTGVTTVLHEKFNSQGEALDHFDTALGVGAVTVIV